MITEQTFLTLAFYAIAGELIYLGALSIIILSKWVIKGK